MLGRVVLQPCGPRLSHYRRTGEEAGTTAVLVDTKIARNDNVEQRLDRAGQRPHYAGDQDRGVARGTVLANPPNGLRGKPAQDMRSHRCVDETFQGGKIGAAIAAIDRPQEGAAISLLSAQVRREAPHHLPDLGQLLSARQLWQSGP